MILNEEKITEKEEPEDTNLNFFYNLFNNENVISKIINLIKDSIETFIKINNSQYNDIFNLYEKFSTIKYKAYFFNSPLYKIKISLEKIIIFNIYYIQSFQENIDILKSILIKLSKLQILITYISNRFNNAMNDKEMKTVYNKLIQSLDLFEKKIVDEYISEKYNKHISSINNEIKICDLAEHIKYLDRTLYEYQEIRNNSYFKEIKEYNKKIQNMCSSINGNFETYINFLKEQNKQFNTKLETFEKDIKIKGNMSKDLKDNLINSKFGFDSPNENKYRIKILENNKIYLENKSNSNDIKSKNGDKKDKKSKCEKNLKIKHYNSKEEVLFLTEEDKYEIISKLYSYNFLIIEKSEYNLDIEKGKLEAVNLSKEILLYNNDDNKEKEKLLNEKYDEIIKSIDNVILNNIKNTYSFFIVLNNYRVSQKIKFSEKFFDLIAYIFNKAQDLLLKSDDQKLSKLLLVLSQTYYKEINGTKKYIISVIKYHQLFKNKEFWKNSLIMDIEEQLKINSGFSKDKKDDIINMKNILYVNTMQEFDVPVDIILEVINEICNEYECNQEVRISSLSFLNINNKINT
jgi:hypothetical protein